MSLSTHQSRHVNQVLDRLHIATADGIVGPGGGVDALKGRLVGSIAVGRTGLWALVDKRELHHIDGSGSRHVATIHDGSAVVVHAHGEAVYVGGDQGELWRLEDGGLQAVQSFNNAPSRNEWYTPWGGPPSVFSMAHHDDDLYVSVHVGGVIASNDNGNTWRSTIDLHDDVHQVIVGPTNGAIYAATGMKGLAESRDRGRSWRYHTAGLHGTYLLAAAVTSGGVLVGASSGPGSGDGAVYIFDGHRFNPVEGLPGRMDGAVGPRQIVADGDHAALADPDGSVHVSGNGGQTWQQALGSLASPVPLLTPRAFSDSAGG